MAGTKDIAQYCACLLYTNFYWGCQEHQELLKNISPQWHFPIYFQSPKAEIYSFRDNPQTKQCCAFPACPFSSSKCLCPCRCKGWHADLLGSLCDPLPPATTRMKGLFALPTYLFISAHIKLRQGPCNTLVCHIPLHKEWQSLMKSLICQHNDLQGCIKWQLAFWHSDERVMFRINIQLASTDFRVLLFPRSQEGVTDRALGQHSEDILILYHSDSNFELLPLSHRPGQRDGPALLQCSIWTFSRNFFLKDGQLQLATSVQRKRCIHSALAVLIT